MFLVINSMLVIFSVVKTKGFSISADVLVELSNFPLRENPFFAKVASLGANMNTNGILINETYSGHSCQVLGDLECDGGEMPACSGFGVIDCTDGCPGTEEEFKHFREVMEDKEFASKYPEINKMVKKEKKKEEDNKDTKSMDNEPKAEPSPAPSKKNVQKELLKSLKKCTTWSSETLALLSLAGGDGMKFGSVSDDPNDLTYVAPGAVSNISQIEYDYSEYYDELEEEESEGESTKKRRDVEATTASKLNDVKMDPWKKEPKPVKNVDSILNKQDYYDKLNGVDVGDKKHQSEEDKINMNMIRSVDDQLEMTNLTSLVDVNNTDIDETDDTINGSDEAMSVNITENISSRVKREVEMLRDLFHSAVKLVRSGNIEKNHGQRKLVVQVARRMNLLRKKRELEMPDKEGDMDTMEMEAVCMVKNMTCSQFPLKSKCRGIGIGRCGSNADLMRMLFTPHAVMVGSVSIIVIVMITVGLTYYCYKLKTENRIEPSEEEDQENIANGAVKNTETAQITDNP